MFGSNNNNSSNQTTSSSSPPLLSSNNNNLLSFEDFQKNLYGKLVSATKISNNLPEGDDYSYYETFPQFKNKMDNIGQRILSLTQNLVTSEDPNSKIQLLNTNNDVDELSYRFTGIIDLVDNIIDRIDKAIDPKQQQLQQQSNIYLSSTTVLSNNGTKSNEKNMFYGNMIVRPQSKFDDLIDNSNYPFQPKIKDKPNSTVALDPIFQRAYEIAFGKIQRSKEFETLIYPHPYEHEILNFQYLPKQLLPCKEQLYKGLDETPYTWIETVDQLGQLVEKLKHVEEIAVDLENHYYRSYQGFVCLMQISTRTEDFIIDTLILRSHIHKLNVIFTDPKIVKVLHGSDSDIKWLQRDFGIYMVNMFDTGQASRTLEYPSASLAFLLKYYCSVDANKKYQLADWRIRKIPDEMIKYAREDTHYLLYIYDRLRNELLAKGKSKDTFIQQVLARSRDLCLLKYEKEILDETSHIQFASKSNLQYNTLQLSTLKVLYQWRENISREEDESIRYVLPNQIMLAIVEKSPTTVQDILSVSSTIPPHLKIHAHTIIQDIIKSKIHDVSNQKLTNTGGTFVPQIQNVLQSNSYFQKIIQQQQTQHIHVQQSQQLSNYQNNNLITSSNSNSSNNLQVNNQNISGRYSPIPQHQSHTNSNSPVLSTDQLYKTAKWLSSDMDINLQSNFQQSLLQPLPSRKVATVSPINQTHSNQPFQGSLFDSSDESGGDDIENRKTKRLASMVSSSFETSSFAPVFKPSQYLKNFDSQFSNNTKSPSDQTMGGTSDVGEFDDDEDDEDENENENEDFINNNQNEEGGTSDGDNKSIKSIESEGDPMDEDEENDDASNQVPKSMQEIYHLSNMNRRRNKEKKKLKENTSAHGSTSPNSMLTEQNITPLKTSKKEDLSGPDTLNFLKEIGWINNESDAFNPLFAQQLLLQQQQQAQQPTQSQQNIQQSHHQHHQQQTNQQPKSGKSSTNTKKPNQIKSHQYQQVNQKSQPQQQSQQPFVSFDYASISQQQPQQQQNQQFFNLDFQATGKKKSNPNSRSKSGSFYSAPTGGNQTQYNSGGNRGKK